MTLKEAAAMLKRAGVDEPLFEARLIFSELGGIKKEELVFGNPNADEKTANAVERRALREPLAYILGYAYFYRERYKVDRSCLIPRQETELLVELAVKSIPKGESFIDLCTGSGCIAISVLKNTVSTFAKAADIFKPALSVAMKNAKENGVTDRIEFIEADVLDKPLCDEVFAVLSNPPYIKNSVYEELSPEVKCEPKTALVGGDDGADFYRRITELYSERIKSNGFILFEIGFDQGDILSKIAKAHALVCEIKKDYSGLDRLALLRKI